MTICTQNKLLEYYITSWAKEFITIDSDCSTFNSDLKNSCNEFIRSHLENLGIQTKKNEILASSRTIRYYLRNYIKRQNSSIGINFKYNHHYNGCGVKGIRISNPIEHEERILKNIRKQLSKDYAQLYPKENIHPFVFNQQYKIDYYQELKTVISQLPKYFFPLFKLNQQKWRDIYKEELNKLRRQSNSKWYTKKRKFERLFPSSYGLNRTYPRYKIYPTYGTIISFPRQLRQNILNKLNESEFGKFFTIDFVACHLNIIVGLFQQDAPLCYKLLIENLFWDTIINQTKIEYEKSFKPYPSSILSDENLKLILKKFVYKKLQGGNIRNTKDIYASLNPNLQRLLGRNFNSIAKCIQNNTYVKEIEKITKKIASEKTIYTPEYLEGYHIHVKRQRISRLATGIEMCLLLHLVLVIIELPENFIPISLEHDGLLLYGQCNNIEQYIKTINSKMKKYSNTLIQHPIMVELKN